MSDPYGRHTQECKLCKGKGWTDKEVTCPQCKGRGFVVEDLDKEVQGGL